jgi:hypothetical protein
MYSRIRLNAIVKVEGKRTESRRAMTSRLAEKLSLYLLVPYLSRQSRYAEGNDINPSVS